MSLSVAAALRRGAEALAAAGIEDARREARMLLHHALGIPDRALPAPGAVVNEQQFAALVARRAAREPMAFILGRQGFWTLDLEVTPATLIPRPDTETLVHAALAAFPERGRVRSILDLGTGTGALLLAALSEFSGAWGVGIDLSADAAALAARNARANGLGARAAFLGGDWAAALDKEFDLVLANPPYIRSGDIAGLMPEVAVHEPRAALDGGPDGMEAYARILADLPRLLAPEGVAVLELGQGQAAEVAKIAVAAGFARALVLRRPAP
jgi:release factor glutamine methyltransferase